jgi:hypothetical protein
MSAQTRLALADDCRGALKTSMYSHVTARRVKSESMTAKMHGGAVLLEDIGADRNQGTTRAV